MTKWMQLNGDKLPVMAKYNRSKRASNSWTPKRREAHRQYMIQEHRKKRERTIESAKRLLEKATQGKR